MCGGGDVSFPKPSDAQVSLEQQQVSLLQQQQNEMNGFQPLMLDQYGYQKNSTYDQSKVDQLNGYINAWKNNPSPTGENRTFSQDERDQNVANYQNQLNDYTAQNPQYVKTQQRLDQEAAIKPLQDQALALAKSQMDWQQKALNGELPVSDALTQQKAIDFAKLKEQLGQNGDVIMGDEPGSATAKSTSGGQALTDFNKRYQALEDEERRGIMTQMNGSQNAAVGTVGGTTDIQRSGVPYSPYSSLMSGYNQALQPYMQQQQGMFQSDMFNTQQQNQRLTGLMQLGGSGAGAAASAAPLLLMSSRTFKKNLTQLTEADEDSLMEAFTSAPVFRYHYKDEADQTPRHVGFVTEEAPPEVVSEDGKHLDVVNYFGLITVALKVLNRKIDKLGKVA